MTDTPPIEHPEIEYTPPTEDEWTKVTYSFINFRGHHIAYSVRFNGDAPLVGYEEHTESVAFRWVLRDLIHDIRNKERLAEWELKCCARDLWGDSK